MNAYFLSGGIVGDPPEMPTRLVDIVLAETRSKARYIFWQKYRLDLGDMKDSWCEFCWKVSSGLDLAQGFTDDLTPLANGILWGVADRMYRERGMGSSLKCGGFERAS